MRTLNLFERKKELSKVQCSLGQSSHTLSIILFSLKNRNVYILLYQCWEISNFLLKRIQKVPKEKDDSVYENENANDAKEMQVSDNLKDPKTFALTNSST